MRTVDSQRTRLIPFKRRLKANRTLTERMLADAMRMRKWWFKEQSALYDATHAYIADFIIDTKNGKIVIEIDGASHQSKARYDAKRDDWMNQSRTYRVLRFTDKEVFHHLPAVLTTIGSFYPRSR